MDDQLAMHDEGWVQANEGGVACASLASGPGFLACFYRIQNGKARQVSTTTTTTRPRILKPHSTAGLGLTVCMLH